MKHVAIDMIVHRAEMRRAIAKLLEINASTCIGWARCYFYIGEIDHGNES